MVDQAEFEFPPPLPNTHGTLVWSLKGSRLRIWFPKQDHREFRDRITQHLERLAGIRRIWDVATSISFGSIILAILLLAIPVFYSLNNWVHGYDEDYRFILWPSVVAGVIVLLGGLSIPFVLKLRANRRWSATQRSLWGLSEAESTTLELNVSRSATPADVRSAVDGVTAEVREGVIALVKEQDFDAAHAVIDTLVRQAEQEEWDRVAHAVQGALRKR